MAAGSGGAGQAPWWIVYDVAQGGSGGVATPKVVQAAKQPQAGGNIEWVFGPYSSKAAAQKLIDSGGPPWPPISARGAGGDTSASSINPQHSSGPLGLAAIGAFLSHVADGRMWASVGWILLGAVMVIVGIVLWLKKAGYVPGRIPVI